MQTGSHVAALLFKIEAKEIQEMNFMKPKHKRELQLVDCTEEDKETPPAKRTPESGQHDIPKLSSQRLYSVLYEVVPQACLFTVMEAPSQTSMEIPSLEQTTQHEQLDVPVPTLPVSNSVVEEHYTQEQDEEQFTE